MARVATRSKGTASITTIDESMEAYLIEVRANFFVAAGRSATAVLSMLRNYLNNDDHVEEPTTSFCKRSLPATMIERLDRFLRYRIMREQVVTFEEQDCAFLVTYDFCEWLRNKGLLPDKEYRLFQNLRDGHLEMWKKGDAVAQAIAISLQGARSGRSAEVIEFARHDILKIEGDQIWLEIWLPMILPKETKIGPITLPKTLAASLQVGWMITCELRKSKAGWRITEIGNIYPSLPFK